jgi:glycosyltransferase involved in cell wall biosynthesis
MSTKSTSYKILILNDTLRRHGGAEDYTWDLKKLLEDNGHETLMYGEDTKLGLLDSFFSRWYSFRHYRKVESLIKSFEPDIVHVQNFSRALSPSVIIAATRNNVPVVQTVHDYHYICPKLWLIDDNYKEIKHHTNSAGECLVRHLPKKNTLYDLARIYKAKFHRTIFKNHIQAYICPSLLLKENYDKKFPNRGVHYVPNFIDKEIKLSKKYGRNILFVGRLSQEKGVEVLIEAFSKLATSAPDITLTIVGSGSEKDSLREKAASYNCSGSINFVGKVRNDLLEKYYLDAATVVIPSIWIENCPLVALEAMTYGCPIVASDAGGLKELVDDGVTGLLFPRGDSGQLSNALKSLLGDEKLQQQMREAQQVKALDYKKDRYLSRLLGIYGEVLNHE